MTKCFSFDRLTDDELLARVKAFAGREREATAFLIAALAELDARRLYLAEGCSSLFTYCTEVLHLSEHAAYARIEAARAAKRFPTILERLRDGSLTLTAVCLLAPHLTDANHREVLISARHKSKRQVEVLTATLRPQAPVPPSIRKLPDRARATVGASLLDQRIRISDVSPDLVSPPRLQPASVKPLAPERFRIQFTMSHDAHENLRAAQDLLRHVLPGGDIATIVERALTLLVDDLRRRKVADARRPRPMGVGAPSSRHLPACVRREVWRRDNGQCAFKGTGGRCSEHGFLEFHHVVPYADGGAATVDNIELRCRAHNVYESEQYFGTLFVRERLGPDRVANPPLEDVAIGEFPA